MADGTDEKKTEETPVADNTPDTPAPEKAAETPPAPAADSGLREVVERLEETVNGLAAQVAQLAPTPGVTDETPVSSPWTHKRIF